MGSRPKLLYDFAPSDFDTGISISFIEWTWDSLPAKATRPMASTSLGTLVVMATRLGMQWRIDLEKDSYQAVGNGYTLSCTQVPEMGLVASFTADDAEERNFDRALAFNRWSDMLVCGIIPGAKRLVDVDFYCTDDSGTTSILRGVSHVVDDLAQLQSRLHSDLTPGGDRDRGLDMLADEIMALLCDLPQKTDDGQKAVYTYNFPGGVFASPSTSDAWLNTFNDRARSSKFCIVFDALQRLRHTGGGDSFCRRLYDQTTLWFVAHGFGIRSHGHTNYVHLVTAHCLMSHEAWKATLRCLENPRVDNGDQHHSETGTRSEDEDGDNGDDGDRAKIVRKTVTIFGADLSWTEKGPPVEIQDRALALMYLEKVYRGHGLTEHCRQWKCEVLPEDAWTVLMLRGIAWSMLTRRKSFVTGQAIPSSCWENQRPVWII